jgi:DNA-binding transcriptional MocR family regulator
MSNRFELPAQLRAFLYSCIDSVEQMEMLMVLKESARPWSARQLAHEVGTEDRRARAHLEALTARGLVQAAVREEGLTYTFRPASASLAGYCDDLEDYLRRSRADVMRFVTALPPPSIRSFANAFKLREPEE